MARSDLLALRTLLTRLEARQERLGAELAGLRAQLDAEEGAARPLRRVPTLVAEGPPPAERAREWQGGAAPLVAGWLARHERVDDPPAPPPPPPADAA